MMFCAMAARVRIRITRGIEITDDRFVFFEMLPIRSLSADSRILIEYDVYSWHASSS